MGNTNLNIFPCEFSSSEGTRLLSEIEKNGGDLIGIINDIFVKDSLGLILSTYFDKQSLEEVVKVKDPKNIGIIVSATPSSTLKSINYNEFVGSRKSIQGEYLAGEYSITVYTLDGLRELWYSGPDPRRGMIINVGVDVNRMYGEKDVLAFVKELGSKHWKSTISKSQKGLA